MDCEAFKRELLAHLVRMASQPGWKAYAWQAANDHAQAHHCLFSDLPELLKQAMNSQKETK